MDAMLLLALIPVYFLPWLLAIARRHPKREAIAALNLFLGWTLLGWVGARIWVYLTPPQSKPRPRNGRSNDEHRDQGQMR